MKTGVVLTTYGEPDHNTFGAQWMYSYRILERLTRKIARIPKPLLPVIATARARARVAMWRQHAFASPLEPLHERTVEALRRELGERGQGELLVTRAYEFRRPDLGDALAELTAQGCERAVVVPMYIAGGDFTDGMTRIAMGDALRRRREWSEAKLAYCLLSGERSATERLALTLAGHCLRRVRAVDIPRPAREWALMLAAHGTVITPPSGVDNGLAHFGRVLLRVKALLRPHFGLVRIGWLNHTRGGKWTTPPVNEALRYVRERGFEQLVYFPWGFTTDNAETALEGRVALAGVSPAFARVEYLPCLNADSEFVSLLADRVLETIDVTNQAARHVPAALAQ
jgi:ferrochelatase